MLELIVACCSTEPSVACQKSKPSVDKRGSTEKPKIVVRHTGTTNPAEMEAVVRRQLEFRRSRSRDRQRRLELSSSLEFVGEDVEETRTFWLRLSAIVLIQTVIRWRGAASSAKQRTPVFLRVDYEGPDEAEFNRRVTTLKRRFPPVVTEAKIAVALRDCVGHAGYAAHQLQQQTGCVPVAL